MNNECMIILTGGNLIYFKTYWDKAELAFSEFLRVLEDNMINIDNMHFELCVLMNSEQEVIDEMTL